MGWGGDTNFFNFFLILVFHFFLTIFCLFCIKYFEFLVDFELTFLKIWDKVNIVPKGTTSLFRDKGTTPKGY